MHKTDLAWNISLSSKEERRRHIQWRLEQPQNYIWGGDHMKGYQRQPDSSDMGGNKNMYQDYNSTET